MHGDAAGEKPAARPAPPGFRCTTLIAAERAGRRGFDIEIEPRYVDVALRRFRTITGIEPVHVASDQTLAELERTASKGRNRRRQS